MLLRNFDFAKKYFDYNSKYELEDVTNPSINGWYKYINGKLSALLVKDYKLYFLYIDNMILITKSHQVLLKDSDENVREFILVNDNKILVKFLYTSSSFSINISPFEYLDEDDNWGEFIARIINDKERQKNFVNNLMDK